MAPGVFVFPYLETTWWLLGGLDLGLQRTTWWPLRGSILNYQGPPDGPPQKIK